MKRNSGKGLSRRDFLKYSGAAALTGAFSGAGTRRASGKISAEELVVAFSGDPGHLDPRVEAGGIGWSILNHMVDTCVFRDLKSNPIPRLVEKWEQVSPTALRFHLRKGVTFHNKEDFTAEAVKVSIQQLTAPDSRSPERDRLAPIKDFAIHDPHTIDLLSEKPFRPLLRMTTSGWVISPRALRELGGKFSTNPVGTGQMKFVEYKPGQHVVMEANPDYWGKKSNFKQLRVRFIPENGTRLAALEADEVMFVNNVPPDQIPRLRANPNLKVAVTATNRVMFVVLRCDRKPFDDKRVRQAMNYAVDKEAITQGIMSGMAKISKAPLAEAFFGAHPSLPPYKYDPDRAKKMLTEAGAMGATFYFGAPNGRYLMDRQVGEAIAGYLSAAGLNVKFENPPWSTLVAEITKFEKSKYDGYFFGWGAMPGDPDAQMWDQFHSKAVRRTMYNNPEVDRLLDGGRETFDEEKVKGFYYKAQEIIWDECPWIFTYQQPDICAVNKKLQWTARPDELWLFLESSLGA